MKYTEFFFFFTRKLAFYNSMYNKKNKFLSVGFLT